MTRIKKMIKFSALSINKIILLIVALALIFSFFVPASFAQETNTDGTPLIAAPAGSIDSSIDPTNLPQLVINLIFGSAMFLAVAYLMFGGVRWITSRGDKNGIADARKHIIAAIIGLVVVIGTFFIINLIFRLVGNEGNNPLNNGFNLPSLKNPDGGAVEEEDTAQ